MVVWTLNEALPFVATLRGLVLEEGFSVALAGSILYRGYSEKDLDLVVFPLDASAHCPADLSFLKSLLVRIGMEQVRDRVAMTEGWRVRGSFDTKHVEEWAYRGKRIDLMFLQ